MREITLNGVKYPVSFSTMAIYQLQKELQLDGIEKVFDILNNGVDFVGMSTLFWLGLKSNRKNITLEQALAIIDTEQNGEFIAQFGDVVNELVESLQRLMPVSEENSKNTKSPA